MTVADCCTPLLEEPIDAEDADLLANRFRALGDPTRVRLISLIADRGEVCACELVDVVAVSQPTLSHHLKILYQAGLVDRERRGRWVNYRVRREAVEALRSALS